ncbi:DUF3069 domain-containing protein [Vibrio salinus]|uniref:DUF3069 domain-containing protein n=1 Tax=Vibrio salinus TaxID=2899784 RepID=UPI001E2A77E2|nr:DUF3069 domain-containing protein [Vibrio salinus]MCE0495382.1 DUF3069 domain-containing protein [Vibrio salinus]
MSESEQTAETKIDLTKISQELRQVIKFEEIPEAMHNMIVSIHDVSEDVVREAWDKLPKSAQNILDNFEQFHSLISVSQAFAGVSVMEEFPTLNLPEDMTEEDKEEYRAELLDQALHSCVKDIVKQIKKARRDPILKREFTEVFTD